MFCCHRSPLRSSQVAFCNLLQSLASSEFCAEAELEWVCVCVRWRPLWPSNLSSSACLYSSVDPVWYPNAAVEKPVCALSVWGISFSCGEVETLDNVSKGTQGECRYKLVVSASAGMLICRHSHFYKQNSALFVYLPKLFSGMVCLRLHLPDVFWLVHIPYKENLRTWT